MNDSKNQIVKYEVNGQEIQLSPDIIRNYLVSGDGRVTDQEVMMFLSLCKYQKLNPFLREAYLVKYGNQAATIVTGKETYTKRAAASPLCDGYKAGIYVVTKDGDIQKRAGAMFVKSLGETVVGGWAEVYRKDWKVPICTEVAFDEYVGRKRDGSITKMWNEKGATMIRKVALVQALREALPEELGGTYSPEEINSVNMDDLSEDAVEIVQSPVEPTVSAEDVITEKQRTMLFSHFQGHEDKIRAVLEARGVESTKEILKADFDSILKDVGDMILLAQEESNEPEDVKDVEFEEVAE